MAHTGTVGETALAPVLSASAVLIAGIVVFGLLDAGPLSIQMAQHLVVMNVIAPAAAMMLSPRMRTGGRGQRRSLLFWAAGLAQIALLWVWHAPSVQTASASSFGLHIVLMLLLALVATAFWTLLLIAAAERSWSVIAGLLLTGKLACLLGALMIFAGRDLYLLPGLSMPFCSTGPSTLEDQQLAGLLMITACPLSYLVAGVVLAAQMFTRIDTQPRKPGYGGFAAS